MAQANHPSDRDPRERHREGREFRESLATTQHYTAYNSMTASQSGMWLVLAGIWLIIAPFVLGYSGAGPALWNDIMLGIVVGTIALVGSFTAPRLASLANLATGVWLIIAPFAIGYGGSKAVTSAWNDIILGAIVGLVSLGALGMSRREEDM